MGRPFTLFVPVHILSGSRERTIDGPMGGISPPIPSGPASDLLRADIHLQNEILDLAREAKIDRIWRILWAKVSRSWGRNADCHTLLARAAKLCERARSSRDQINSLLEVPDEDGVAFQLPRGLHRGGAEMVRFELLRRNQQTITLAEACSSLIAYTCGAAPMRIREVARTRATFRHYRDRILEERS